MRNRLTERDLSRIIKKVLNESSADVSGIVHRHIDGFVNETLNKFMDVMDDITSELMKNGITPAAHFNEVEIHFEKEMMGLSQEVIHKIHEDEELQNHMKNSPSSDNFSSHH